MKTRSKKINGVNPFEQKWGVNAKDFAKEERVSPEAIYMRVRNFGTPFQRLPKPQLEEIMYGKTTGELAHELGCHPVTIKKRLRELGTIYLDNAYTHNMGRQYSDKHWTESNRYTKPSAWLHPLHPMYTSWRYELVKHLLNGGTIDSAIEQIIAKGNWLRDGILAGKKAIFEKLEKSQ